MSNSSIWTIDRTLSGATIPGQRETETNGSERVLPIPQSSKTGASLSDDFVSNSGHSFWFYLSAEI